MGPGEGVTAVRGHQPAGQSCSRYSCVAAGLVETVDRSPAFSELADDLLTEGFEVIETLEAHHDVQLGGFPNSEVPNEELALNPVRDLFVDAGCTRRLEIM